MVKKGRLISAKRKFNPYNKVMMMSGGFPDFIAFKNTIDKHCEGCEGSTCEVDELYEVIGVECKTNGKLDKGEKEKCRWLLDNNIFSKILIASKRKVKNRIEIDYNEFQN